MPPSKSPAKTRPVTPTRASTRTSKTPTRLGADDNWGSGSAGKWVSETKATKEAADEAAYLERKAHVEELERKQSKKNMYKKFAKYKKFMSDYKWPATIMQTVVLTLLGFVIGQMIKKKPLTLVESSQWAGWGVITATTSLPYLMWLSKKKFNKKPKMDAVLKALFNQAFFSQVLNALFLSYMALLAGGDPMAAIKGGLLGQAKLCAMFWLPSDLINMYLIPVQAQMLWNSAMGVAWSAVLAYSF